MRYKKIIEFLEKYKGKTVNKIILSEIYRKQYNNSNSRTINNTITYLKNNNIITEIKKDLFLVSTKNKYLYKMSIQEQEIYDLLQKKYPKINTIVWNTKCINDFMLHFSTNNYIIIETEKCALECIANLIKEKYTDNYTVITEKIFNNNRNFFKNEKVIIIKALNTKSPIININNKKNISIEKIMVDIFCDEIYIQFQGKKLETIYENIFEEYDINFKKLLKYSKYRTSNNKYIEFLKKINLPDIYKKSLDKSDEKEIFFDEHDLESYKILQCNKDFVFTNEINNKGSRKKRTVIDINNRKKAIFKYQMYECSESCSEKISYEIAKVLNYECAEIELAKDEKGDLGILNYLFVDKNNNNQEHIDIISYINKKSESRKEFYTIDNIKKCLDEINSNLFYDFLKIMVFDALIGEQDRHEENWGVIVTEGKYKISPLYDNGCSLLREFYSEKNAQKYYSGEKDFDAFIKRSKTLIYKDSVSKYKHFELIRKLYFDYPEKIREEINNLKKLTNEKIDNIVNKIPIGLITKEHKEYIKKYIKKRRDILLSIIEERNV